MYGTCLDDRITAALSGPMPQQPVHLYAMYPADPAMTNNPHLQPIVGWVPGANHLQASTLLPAIHQHLPDSSEVFPVHCPSSCLLAFASPDRIWFGPVIDAVITSPLQAGKQGPEVIYGLCRLTISWKLSSTIY